MVTYPKEQNLTGHEMILWWSLAYVYISTRAKLPAGSSVAPWPGWRALQITLASVCLQLRVGFAFWGEKLGEGGHQACEVDALNGQLFRAPLKALVRVISDVVCIWTIILFNLKDPKVEPWPRQRWPFLAVDLHVTMANLVHLFWRPHMEPIWNIDPYLSY